MRKQGDFVVLNYLFYDRSKDTYSDGNIEEELLNMLESGMTETEILEQLLTDKLNARWAALKLAEGDAKLLSAIKENLQLINNSLLLLSSVSTAETRNRRHQFIYVRSGCFDFSITECIFHKLSGVLRL